MKWFKHLSDAGHDEKLAEVLDLHGASGYGAFWLIVEAVASQMDKSDKCEVKYSMKKWSYITHTDRRTLAKYLQTFGNLALIVLQICDKIVTIKIPKLLDLRDNHTTNLQVTKPATCKQEVEVEVEVEVDKEKPKPKSVVKRFTPPQIKEVNSYCQERKNNVNPERFIDHYTANGWKVGKNKMIDWKAAVRTWEKESKPRKTGLRFNTGEEICRT